MILRFLISINLKIKIYFVYNKYNTYNETINTNRTRYVY